MSLPAGYASTDTATAVLTLAEALKDKQVSARNLLRRSEHPAIGTLPMVGSPLWRAVGPDGKAVDLGGSDDSLPAPPLLGQQTASVLEEDLGLSPEEIAELVESGVVALEQRN